MLLLLLPLLFLVLPLLLLLPFLLFVIGPDRLESKSRFLWYQIRGCQGCSPLSFSYLFLMIFAFFLFESSSVLA